MESKLVELPIVVRVEEEAIQNIAQFLSENEIISNHILIISGQSTSYSYATIVQKQFPASKLVIVKVADESEVNRIISECKKTQYDLLMGVGGGKVLDLVKRASLFINIPNILIPTIISNDGLFSPVAVIRDKENFSQSLPGQMPIGIIVDLEIIIKAPKKFLQAAAGDLLSNVSATNDWILAKTNSTEKVNNIAYILSKGAAHALLLHERKNISDRYFIKQIVYSQIQSGFAMSIAGTSRPCSGSEHLISHAIDFLKLSTNTLHGLQVGTISIFCLYLQKRLDINSLSYANQLNIPYAFHNLNPSIIDNLELIYETALKMRPGRFTILNLINKEIFREQYHDFLIFLNRFKSENKE